MYTSRIYKYSPVVLQNVMVSVRGFLMLVFRNLILVTPTDDIAQSQWLSSEGLAQLQLKRLQSVISHAAVFVPYYRDLFGAIGFSPDQLRSLDDMQRISLLGNRQVFYEGMSLLAENYKGYRFRGSTSGTTGMSLKLWRNLRAIYAENAFVERQCNWAGVRLGDRRVWIREDNIVPANVAEPPFWRYNMGDNTLMMSIFHLSERHAEAYIQAMEAFDPVFGMAYSSPLAFLARYLLSKGRCYRGKSLRSVITSSETLTDEQRSVIQEAFGCRVFDWYGSSERVTAIGTCEQGTYHILSDYGFTELIPQDNGTCTLVGTGFDNLLMPLIRYQLDDVIIPADPAYICLCGRSFPVVEQIMGRTEDYLLAPDGRQIFMAGGIIDGLDDILESQIKQDKYGEVTILVVPAKASVLNTQKIIAHAQEFLGKDMRINLEIVEVIPKTNNGKFRAVIRTV
jgi:phenylacetate-CoA ligase